MGGDEQALKRFDRPTITALESRAPGASTADAQFLRNQGRAIFSAFTDHERDQILDRLPMVDGLILTLSSFFKDLNYLQLLIDCLKRLVIVPKRRSVCETIQSKYTGVNQQEGQVKIQVTEDAEDTFVYKSGTDADRVDLGWRQLVALAMRYYPYMPRDPIKEDAVKKATTRADQAVLRQLADLAYQLGFESTQIHALRQHSSSRIAGDDDPQFPPLHVTSGAGIEMRQRSGIPRTQAYKEDRYSLFINPLHDTQAYQGEGITSFFVRKSVYLAFFGRPDEASIIHSLRIPPFSSGSAFDSTRVTSELRGASENSEADDRHLSNQERLEQERRELRRIEETLEREDLQERLAQAFQAQQNLEQEKRRQQQHEKQEQERQEEERRRQGTREQGRREQEALVQGRALVQGGAFAQGGALVERRALNDSERTRKRHTQIDMESLDAIGNQRGLVIVGQAQERQHYTGQEIPGSNLQSGRELVLADPSNLQAPVNNRLEQEGLEGLERARLEQERLEQERLEQERLEQERLERERLEQERLERERLEQERLEQERLERLEQERLELERLERERLELERLEQERLELEKLDQEKQDQKKREQEQKKREQELEKLELDRRKGERQRRQRREQGRREQEKTIESEGGLAAESTEPRPRRRQVSYTLHYSFQRAHFYRIQLRWLRRQTPSGSRSRFGNEAFGGPLKVSMFIPLIHPRSSE